jgi:Big-like domain-containing protein
MREQPRWRAMRRRVARCAVAPCSMRHAPWWVPVSFLACIDGSPIQPPPPPPRVAAVQVSPVHDSIVPGGIAQFAATLLDSAGGQLTGRPVTWASADSSVARSSGDGLFSGVDVGSTTVSATSEGKQGLAELAVVSSSPPGTWPNEPAGFSPISDQPFDLLSSLGWVLEFGTATTGLDANAPLTPPSVLEILYPIGFPGGSAPGTMTRAFTGVRELYVGTWWKASSPWQGHNSNVNKIQYVFTNGSGSAFLAMYGPPGGPWELRVFPQFTTSNGQWLTPNVSNVPVTVGVWHRLEWLLVENTTTNPANGIVRWWMDGQLIGDYGSVSFPQEALGYVKIAPVWGGVGDVKTELDYFWYDQVHLSGR